MSMVPHLEKFTFPNLSEHQLSVRKDQYYLKYCVMGFLSYEILFLAYHKLQWIITGKHEGLEWPKE